MEFSPDIGKLFELALGNASGDTWQARCAQFVLIMFVLILTFFFLKLLFEFIKIFLEVILTLKEQWSKIRIGLSAEQEHELRRRQQFCQVLSSDLDALNKAESWNDQFFTDLEAQVEAEGKFYATKLDRWRKRESIGLRHVPSLIQAIESSAEQFLLLIGDPGSGKSVALRHLARQLSEKTMRSRSSTAFIPLYINLKELPPPPTNELSADFIKSFVIDNIRRGDADTADYVREKWDEYRQKGIWFFLFDSFDEIPAILHAPSDSDIIAQHTEAIRQFLAGMSSCRGIIASREFKCPNLVWQRLRILALSTERQERLIENSFLPADKKEIVRRYLAETESHLRRTPLFLSLLCRYVKDMNRAPANELSLLDRHLERLTQRDEAFVCSKYGLTSEQLMNGAVELARLFAESPELSLSPTIDEIVKRLQNRMIAGLDMENLLSALIYVKVGRSDVQEARPGDRRFSFAHRRYQETLFVRYLAQHVDHLSRDDLLTDPRWREYTVTLLQTQSTRVITPILTKAARLLSRYRNQARRESILPEFGGHLYYYNWHNDPSIPLLQLLQEGLAHRLDDIPAQLRNQVELLLMPRWQDGDFYDREIVLQLGGLLPERHLLTILHKAIVTGTSGMLGQAFHKVFFLKLLPDELATWVRSRISRAILTASDITEVLKLGALAARLPEQTGASFVATRCARMRRSLILRILWKRVILSDFNFKFFRTNKTLEQKEQFKILIISALLFYRAALMISLSIVVVMLMAFYPNVTWWRLAINCFLLAVVIFVSYNAIRDFIMHITRDIESPLNFTLISKRLRSRDWRSSRVSSFVSFFSTLTSYSSATLTFTMIVSRGQPSLAWFLISSYILVAGYFAMVWSLEKLRMRKALSRLSEYKEHQCKLNLPEHATSGDELLDWLRWGSHSIIPSMAHVRSLGRLALSIPVGRLTFSTPVVPQDICPLAPKISPIAIQYFSFRPILGELIMQALQEIDKSAEVDYVHSSVISRSGNNPSARVTAN